MREDELADRMRKNPGLRIVHDTSIVANADNVGNAHNCSTYTDAHPTVLSSEAAAMLEAELQSELKKIAKANGYLYYHTHDSRRSDTGFPDTVLLKVNAKRGWLYFVECKREGEDPRDDQREWLEALRAFDRLLRSFTDVVVVDGFVWRPSDLLSGTIARVLSQI